MNAGVTTLVAGSEQGTQDGTGAAAQFNLPGAVAVDKNGTLYIADTGNNSVRKITTAGVVTTIATGLNSPRGIAVDDSLNVYVSDTQNHCIKKIAGTTVTVLAGVSGTSGKADGAGTSTRFNSPEGLTIDKSGNLFVADTGNYRICKVISNGTTNVVAGGSVGFDDGSGTSAKFLAPLSVAVDTNGTLWVTDGSLIRKVTAAGVVSGVQVDGGISFETPTLTTDRTQAGSVIYVTDRAKHAVYSLVPSTTTAGGLTATLLAGDEGTNNYVEGTGTAARFSEPNGCAVKSDGAVFVVDTLNHRVRKLL